MATPDPVRKKRLKEIRDRIDWMVKNGRSTKEIGKVVELQLDLMEEYVSEDAQDHFIDALEKELSSLPNS